MAILRVPRSDWASGAGWNGKLEGKGIGTDVSFLFNSVEQDGAGPPRHAHPYDELYIVREGRALVEIDGDSATVEAGDIVLVPANKPHIVRTLGTQRTEIISVHLGGEFKMNLLD